MVEYPDPSGPLYGSTYGGGTKSSVCPQGCGTVFSVDPNQPGHDKIVHRFTGAPDDGALPEAGLADVNGVLYGTTFFGGPNGNCYTGRGCGVVFKITVAGSIKESIVYAFKGGSKDGSNPGAIHIGEGGSTFYGTTKYGGAGGVGTVFELSTSGQEHLLYSFLGAPHDGAYPTGNVIPVNGTLYGVTSEGGTADLGTVFKLNLGVPGKEKVLYSFNRSKGDYPVGLEMQDNVLYGTTSADGPTKKGTIFALTATGVLKWNYAFRGFARNDGALPYARPQFVTTSKYGTMLYGTTQEGGSHGNGTIYRLSPSGTHECVLHSFGPLPDGLRPDAPLRMFNNGVLYGTTVEGGSHKDFAGLGTVYEISPEAPCASPSPSAKSYRVR